MEYKKYDYDGFQIYTIRTDKFKNCYMEMNFRDSIHDINTTTRNFLTHLLTYTSLKYPTKREMIIAEEELYNLGASGGCYRVGENVSSYFSIDMLHPKYVVEKDYLEKTIQFAMNIILNPFIVDDLWDERSYHIVRERLHVSVDQYKENPMSFAQIESRKCLFADSITGKRLIGTHEEIDAVSRKDLARDYYHMFHNSHCEMLIIGDLDMDEVVKLVTKHFHKPSIVQKEIPFVVDNKISSFQEKIVSSPFHQTQLIQYYQFPLLSYRERNFVFPLLQKLLGAGGLSDKLGKYLRMENSLCYAYSFQYFLADSYCMIATQLNKDNVEKAQGYIDKAFTEMKKGDFTEEELEVQKKKMLSDLKLKEDSIYGLIDNYYYHEAFDSALFDEYYSELISVSKNDIKNLACKIELTFRYILEEAVSNERD